MTLIKIKQDCDLLTDQRNERKIYLRKGDREFIKKKRKFLKGKARNRKASGVVNSTTVVSMTDSKISESNSQ